MFYKGIENISATQNKQQPVKRKNLHLLTVFLLCFVCVSCFGGVLFSDSTISAFVKRVTAMWTPKTEDFGKIKFVNFISHDSSDNSVFIVSSPFKSYYVKNMDSTTLEVFGLGDQIVLSPIDGVVQKIEFENQKYFVSVASGNVVVKLLELDNVCVFEGDNLKIHDKIAVSIESRIVFQIVCDGEPIELHADKAGDTFFE